MQALRGEAITIYGDGQQTRSFCYVDDLIEGLVRLMNSDDSFTGPVNLGNPVEFTMLELTQNILSKVGTSLDLIFQPLPQDDPRQCRPDITLAGNVLDWRPSISLNDGLTHKVDYFRHQLSEQEN
jgi:UDP-glucuronate decarboxylase